MRPDSSTTTAPPGCASCRPTSRCRRCAATQTPTSRSSAAACTGVSTAWHLSARFPERRIVLLEASALANGASGRNGGQVLNWINGVEPRRARAARGASTTSPARGIDLVADAGRRTRARRRLRARRLPRGVHQRADAEAAAARASSACTPAGIPLAGCRRRAVGVHGAHGAVLDPAAGSGQRRRPAARPAPGLLERGVALYEQTPVTAHRRRRAASACTRPHGRVRAGAVVLATNAYTPRLGFFRDRHPAAALARRRHRPAAAGALGSTRLGRLGRLQRRSRPHRLRLPHPRRPPAVRRRRQRRLCLSLRRQRRCSTAGARRRAPSPPSSAACARYFPALVGAPIAHRWTRPAGHHLRSRLLDGRHRRASQRLLRARLQRPRPRARHARRPRPLRPLQRRPRPVARPALLPEAACPTSRPSRCAGSAITPTRASPAARRGVVDPPRTVTTV